MASKSAGSSRGLPTLASANHEADADTIAMVVRLLSAVITPLTKRDWRERRDCPTGGIVIVANHISNVDPLGPRSVHRVLRALAAIPGQSLDIPRPVVGRIIRLRSDSRRPRHPRRRTPWRRSTEAVRAVGLW